VKHDSGIRKTRAISARARPLKKQTVATTRVHPFSFCTLYETREQVQLTKRDTRGHSLVEFRCGGTGVAETFGKRIIVNLQLSYLPVQQHIIIQITVKRIDKRNTLKNLSKETAT
jgi:hypothetical protein